MRESLTNPAVLNAIRATVILLASVGVVIGVSGYVHWRKTADGVLDSRIYRIGFRENPPYLFVQPDGTPAGLAVEVVSEAAARAHVRLQWVRFQGLNFEFLDKGVGELWPLGDPQDSHQYPTTKPWIRDSFSMLTRTNNARLETIAVNDSVRTISLLKRAYPKAAILPHDGAAKAMLAVCAGHADGVFANARVLHQLLLARPAGCDRMPLHLNHVEEATIPLGILYQRGFKEPAEAIRAAIDDMATDGTLGRRFEKWAHSANNEIELSSLLLESEQRTRQAWRVATVFGVVLLMLLVATVLLYRAHQLSEATNRVKSTFLSMVSHELRTPLQGIVGVLDLLAKEEMSREQRALITTIRVSASSLRRIVGDILEYSRIDAFRFQLNPAPTNIAQLIEGVVVLLSDQAERNGIPIQLEIPDVFPIVEVDGPRLHQVAFNLLDNAIKFTPAGTITVRLAALESKAQSVVICMDVIDSGIGMDPEVVPKMFDAFQQAESGDSRRFGGIGLGLAVSRGIVEQMGGTLELITAPGEGTTARVTIELPRAKGEAQAPIARVETERLRILVVDDNAVNRKVASRMLEKMGHAVDLAENGEAAIARWSEESYDLILMDCQMPVLDGFAATVQIRKLEAALARPRCPVVALTASVEENDQIQCLRAGMDGFVGKPAGFEELAGAVQRYRSNKQ